MQWATGLFPAVMAVSGWRLDVTERRISATPRDRFYDASDARISLEPKLEAWAAELAIIYRLPMDFVFLDAEMAPDVAVAMTERPELTVSDSSGVTATDIASVRIMQETLPTATWNTPPSELARDTREFCLLPLRTQRRTEADAAYWLVELLKEWVGGDLREAAHRLNVSRGYLERMKKLSGHARDRKAARGNEPLTPAEKLELTLMVEEVVRRLHLVEVGESVNEHLTR